MNRISKLWDDSFALYREQTADERSPYIGVHDIDHVVRVLRNANQIMLASSQALSQQAIENVRAAAILHDIGYCRLTQLSPEHQIHVQYSLEISQGFLTKASFTSPEIAEIQSIILCHHSPDHAQKTIPQKIVYVADKLDMIGYDGILRMVLQGSFRRLNRDKIAAALLDMLETRVNNDLLKVGIGQELIRQRWLDAKWLLREILTRGVVPQSSSDLFHPFVE
jgi:HD superfamily phosphodiesterase